MDAKTKTREPVQVVPGWAICISRAGQINSRITIAGLDEEEAGKRLARAPHDDAQRFAILIAAVHPPV